jgi:acetyl esterase/lipase
MGFSAGATLALSIATDPDPAVRPNFVVPVYAPAGKIDVPHNAPPMFAAIAADDGLFAEHGIGLVQAWHDAERPVEFHLYEAGGHGFGVPGVAGTTTTGMMDQLLLWLQARQLFAQTEP